MVAIDLEESVAANSVIDVRAIRGFIKRNAEHSILISNKAFH